MKVTSLVQSMLEVSSSQHQDNLKVMERVAASQDKFGDRLFARMDKDSETMEKILGGLLKVVASAFGGQPDDLHAME